MKINKSHTGQSFYPIDNSYSQDLTTGKYPTSNNGHGLAGTLFPYNPSVLVKIVSQPIFITLKNQTIPREMVIVEYNNNQYLILNEFSNSKSSINKLIYF